MAFQQGKGIFPESQIPQNTPAVEPKGSAVFFQDAAIPEQLPGRIILLTFGTNYFNFAFQLF